VHVLPQEQIVDMIERCGEPPAVTVVTRQVAGVLGSAPEIFVDAGASHIEIVLRAARWGADLIVVGSHGRSGVSSVFGGVAERVVRNARCSVLVVRPSQARGWVLTAVDLSDTSRAVVRAAAGEARRRGARLKVVHAMGFLELEARYIAQLATPPVADQSNARDMACRALEEVASGLGLDVRCELLEGRPVPAVVRAADAIGAELVVVGTRGRTGFARMALGSVAERIVRHAPCSVLVVRR
jgi:nucleotide-binding universal stress UspA family protein